MAVVIAISVRKTGEREVIGLDVGFSEDGAFWLQLLKGLVARGLKGVQLVMSDAHSGLRASDYCCVAWCKRASVSCPLVAQCIGLSSQVGHTNGSGYDPKYLHATGCGHRP